MNTDTINGETAASSPEEYQAYSPPETTPMAEYRNDRKFLQPSRGAKYPKQRYNRRYYYRGNNKGRNIICSNCSGRGHLFKDCKKPIQSYGVLAWTFRYDANKQPELAVCLIQRRHTISYEAFVRGKYHLDELKMHCERMTTQEKQAIRDEPWDLLYDNVMNNKGVDVQMSTNIYTQRERQRAKNLYDSVNIDQLFANDDTPEIEEPTWEFPKGRRYVNENDQHCALREFHEETGIPKEGVTVILGRTGTPLWFQEQFCGINKRQYHNRYLLAFVDPECNQPFIDETNFSQISEVQDARWFSFDDAYAIIHSFHPEKQECLRQSFDAIQTQLSGSWRHCIPQSE